MSGKTSGVATITGAYEGFVMSIQDQHLLYLSEVIYSHQGEAYDASFYSFLTDFYKMLENLK